MPDLAELHLRIKSRDVKQAERRLQDFRREGAKVSRTAQKMSGDLRGSSRAAQALGRSFRRLIVPLGAIISGLIGLGAAAKSIQLAAVFEQTRIGFATLVGGAEEANRLLKELENFAATTPFQFQGLADSAKLMLALGFEAEKLVPTMRTLGDAAAALGGGQPLIQRLVLALGQMQAKAKVSGEEMRQLAESGIPAWEIMAEVVGVTIPEAMKLAERGAIDVTVAIEGLLAGMEKRFKGATEVLAQSVLGLFSTLKDVIDFALRDVGDVLTEAFNISDNLRGAIEFAGKVGKAMKEARDTIFLVIDAMRAMVVMIGILLAFKLASIMIPIIAGLQTLEIVMVGLNVVIGTANATMAVSPIFILAAVVGAVAFAFTRQARSIDDARDALDRMAESMKGLIKAQASLLGAGDLIERIAALPGVLAAMRARIDVVTQQLQPGFDPGGPTAESDRAFALSRARQRGQFRAEDQAAGIKPGLDVLLQIDRELIRLSEDLQIRSLELFDDVLTQIATLEEELFQTTKAADLFMKTGEGGIEVLEKQVEVATQLRDFLVEIAEADELGDLGIPQLAKSTESLGIFLTAAVARLKEMEAVQARLEQRAPILDFIAALKTELDLMQLGNKERERAIIIAKAQSIAAKNKTKLTKEENDELEKNIRLLQQGKDLEASRKIDAQIAAFREQVSVIGLSNEQRQAQLTLSRFVRAAQEQEITLTNQQILAITSLINQRTQANEQLRKEAELKAQLAIEESKRSAASDRFAQMISNLMDERARLEEGNKAWERRIFLQDLANLGRQASIAGLAEWLKFAEFELNALDKLKAAKETQTELEERITFIVERASEEFSSMFTDVILGAQSAGEALEGFARALQRLLVQQLVTAPLAAGISGFIGDIFNPEPAAQGVVLGGRAMVMAQHGTILSGPTVLAAEAGMPEAVMPLTRLPSGDLGVKAIGGGNNQTIIFNITTQDADSFRRSKRQVMGDLARVGRTAPGSGGLSA